MTLPLQLPQIAAPSPKPSDAEVSRGLEQVRQLTSELFEGQVVYTEREDREIFGERYFDFLVEGDGDIEIVLARDAEWHRRVSKLPASMVGLFRLTIEACER